MTSYHALIIAELLLACSAHPSPAINRSAFTHRLSGVALNADGRPAARAIVIVTNPSTANEIALTRTDSQGRFAVDTSELRVSLTATTKSEWVFASNVETTSSSLRLELNANCYQFNGRIELDGPQPTSRLDIMRIGGFDNDILGLFGIEIGTDLSFRGCLPQREYYIVLPDSIAERTTLAELPPKSGELRIQAVSREYAMTPPSQPIDLSEKSQADTVAHLSDDIRLLGLGESNHGSAEYYNERIDLALELARKHQFTLVMVEANYGEILPLDRYIKGEQIVLRDAIKGIGFWMWNTQGFAVVLEKLRAYNQKVASANQISIIGIDVQATKGLLSELTQQHSGLTDAELNMLPQPDEKDGKRWVSLSQDVKMRLRSRLRELTAIRDQGGIGSPVNKRALAASALLHRLELLEQNGFWNFRRARDKAMAQMALDVLSLEPGLRGTLWAHVTHLAREFVPGATTAGERLAASLGNGYQVWAFLALEGAARARSGNTSGKLAEHALPPLPEYSVETVLARSTGGRGLSIGYWDLHQAKLSRSSWLRGLRFIRLFGAHFPEKPPLELQQLSALDGIVLFRHVSPTVPLE